MEKPQLPSKPNQGRGWDTLGTSLSFSSGQWKTLRTCWNFLQQKKTHGRSLFIFDGLDEVQKFHLFSYTSSSWSQPTHCPFPFPWTLGKFIPLFPARVEKAKEKLAD